MMSEICFKIIQDVGKSGMGWVSHVTSLSRITKTSQRKMKKIYQLSSQGQYFI